MATSEAVTFADLDDDSLVQILLCSHDIGDVATFGACSKHLAHLSRSDSLWRCFVKSQWPLLPAEQVAPSQPWRDIYRGRTLLMPSWRYFLGRMDEVQDLFSKLAGGAVRTEDKRDADCNRLAACLISIFCTDELSRHGTRASSAAPSAERRAVLDYTHGRAWARQLTLLACQPSAQDAIREWTCNTTSSLDEFYEPGISPMALRGTLLNALRCASALSIVESQVSTVGSSEESSEPGAALEAGDAAWRLRLEDWGHRKWQHRVGQLRQQVEEALASLEMEGFDVSVPPSLRPAHVPRTGHAWWHAQTPGGYLGGVTNIR